MNIASTKSVDIAKNTATFPQYKTNHKMPNGKSSHMEFCAEPLQYKEKTIFGVRWHQWNYYFDENNKKIKISEAKNRYNGYSYKGYPISAYVFVDIKETENANCALFCEGLNKISKNLYNKDFRIATSLTPGTDIFYTGLKETDYIIDFTNVTEKPTSAKTADDVEEYSFAVADSIMKKSMPDLSGEGAMAAGGAAIAGVVAVEVGDTFTYCGAERARCKCVSKKFAAKK